jgi:hypothetical protein
MNDFEDLMAAWLDHKEFSPERRAELLARLREDDDLRQQLASDVQMQALTRTVQAGEPRWLVLEELLHGQTPEQPEPLEDAVLRQIQAFPTRVFEWGRWLRMGLAAACVVFAFFLGRTLDRPQLSAGIELSLPEEAAPATPVAIIARTANARWKDQDAPRNRGAVLTKGRIRLESGMAEVDFFGGAHVILEGPAELELVSAGEALLHSGIARCTVTEHGKGFRLSPPGMNVTDLGTSFGLTVPTQGEPELHVLDGKVIVSTPGGAPRELNASDAVQLADSQLAIVDYAPKSFPSENELERLARVAMTSRSVEWWDQTLKWQHEPETLLHYTLVSDVYQRQRIENQSPAADAMSHGMVIGCRWAEGRWPWKRGLEFRHRGDRVLLGLPGTYPEISFAKWIRVDAITQPTNILLKSKSAQRATTRIYADATPGPGEIQWELERDGRMHFRISRGEGASEASLSTPPVLRDEWIGHWVMMGVTYDSESGDAIHYFNGRPVAETKMDGSPTIAFEFLELGNPHLDTPEQRRNNRYGFFGAIDELMISKRVLTKSEMKEFFDAGKPAS